MPRSSMFVLGDDRDDSIDTRYPVFGLMLFSDVVAVVAEGDPALQRTIDQALRLPTVRPYHGQWKPRAPSIMTRPLPRSQILATPRIQALHDHHEQRFTIGSIVTRFLVLGQDRGGGPEVRTRQQQQGR